jgi:PAS domain S-box-containing protein
LRFNLPQPGVSIIRAAPQWVGPIGLAVAVGVAYFLAARLSLLLLTKPDGVAVFRPASGIAAGVLISLGPGARWPVAAAAIVATVAANLLGDRNLPSVIVFGVCNAAEALLAAWLIEWWFGPRFELARLSNVLGLVVASAIATSASGLGGTIGYVLFHSSTASALTIWRHWFASDAIGIITVAPLLIELRSVLRDAPPTVQFIEGIGALSALTAVSTVAVFSRELWTIAAPALLFPLLLWLTARCRPVFASAAAFIAALAIVWSTTFEMGYYGDPSVPAIDQILAARATILSVSTCALVLAALFAERRDREDRLRAIVNTVADGIITIDEKGMIENLNPAAARMFGYSPQDVVGRNVTLLMPERYHQEHDTGLKNYLKTGQAKVIGIGTEMTGLHSNGTTFPIELAISEMAVAGRRMFVGAVRDITRRVRNAERQRVLMAELDHRVKNVLARVAMLAASTRKGSTSIDEYVRSLNGRIQSMAAAHGLLSQSGWQNVGLGALVGKQLAPYASGSNVTIKGEDIILGAAEIQAVAMVLHELVTNAAKYGSLSVPDGRVCITWDRVNLDAGAKLLFEWRELGGPPVAAEIPSGYGSSLIRKLIPHELGGMVDLVLAPEGLICKIEIPLEQT